MQSGLPAVVLFDLDGTLLDDAHSVAAALRSFHSRYGDTLGLSFEDLRLRWRELLNLHFARYLAGEISMLHPDQKRARRVFSCSIASGANLIDWSFCRGSVESSSRMYQPASIGALFHHG
jgi:phosphoglycolate phosphatase-like HAD superfamily hydrolase